MSSGSKPRFLTKSLFKVAYECPRKLYYQVHKDYGNNNKDNAFLEALAHGGFQVGELAKVEHPDGIEIETLSSLEALALTNEHLKKENVTLFEAAISFGHCLARVDILRKRGKLIELYEVKAKSYDSTEEDPFYNKTQLKKGIPEIKSAWKPYLMDIAYQTYIARKAFPGCDIESHLTLADTTTEATVDGINQRFLVDSDENGRKRVTVAPNTTREAVGARLLVDISVDDEVELLLNSTFEGQTFEELVDSLCGHLQTATRAAPRISSGCKGCEFRICAEDKEKGLKSGFDECWRDQAGLTDPDLARAFVFDVWNFRKAKDLVDSQAYFMDELTEDEVTARKTRKKATEEPEPGLSSAQRQWLQVQKVQSKDLSPTLLISELAEEMASWTYPLHFIDFETTMVAIPFNRGRRPYEQVAFQFSHHIVREDGSIEHKTEYINRERGSFPNFEFVRALKRALKNDQGTIFRYADHENTVLCQILRQMEALETPLPDQKELTDFIRSICRMTGEGWVGPRCMVDMRVLVLRYYYHPHTRGSNSIKAVLPAVLQDSTYLRQKYGQPIYGAAGGIKSLNFRDWQWIRSLPDGSIQSPYKLLSPLFTDLSQEEMEALLTPNGDDSIGDGAAAMTAYARMQFTQMSDAEAERVSKGLLKYCELDTLAMVMIYEYWKAVIEGREKLAGAPSLAEAAAT